MLVLGRGVIVSFGGGGGGMKSCERREMMGEREEGGGRRGNRHLGIFSRVHYRGDGDTEVGGWAPEVW